jgi:spore maturation protein CgeB
VPWYAAHRDLPDPDFCRVALYRDLDELRNWREDIHAADAVILGSYVPDGVAVADVLLSTAQGVTAFYDIDTPVTLARLGRDEFDYLDPAIIPRFDLYFSFTGGPTLRRLEQEFGARRAEALYCAVDESRYRPTGEEPRWDLSYLGTYSADRQPALERLLIEPARRLPQCRFAVAGPQYPESVDWPANVERIEHLPPEEHARFYGRSRYTLNVTRADMIAAGWSPSVRLFEAAACGCPIVSDRWEGLSELLPDGRAVRIADTTDEVVSVLTGMAEAQRRRMADEARAIVLAAHTGKARAEGLVQTIREAMAGRSTTRHEEDQTCETTLP